MNIAFSFEYRQHLHVYTGVFRIAVILFDFALLTWCARAMEPGYEPNVKLNKLRERIKIGAKKDPSIPFHFEWQTYKMNKKCV